MLSKEELEKISKEEVSKVQPLLSKVTEIANQLINDDSLDLISYNRFQNVLTGIYGHLIIPYKKLKALKENVEAQKFNELKLESDINNSKFVAEIAKREASAYVSDLRTARDLLEGYVEACLQSIITCRTHIWDFKKDIKIS